jgi:predicted naringenin-chalcone synthase
MLAFASETRPEWRDSLRFRNEGGRLKNVLERAVPEQAGEALAAVIGRLLASTGTSASDIGSWILHAGGSRVLDEAEKSMYLPPDALAASRSVLHEFGNMSSPTVLFVLAATLKERRDHRARAVMASFGAGFTAHAALLEL